MCIRDSCKADTVIIKKPFPINPVLAFNAQKTPQLISKEGGKEKITDPHGNSLVWLIFSLCTNIYL